MATEFEISTMPRVHACTYVCTCICTYVCTRACESIWGVRVLARANHALPSLSLLALAAALAGLRCPACPARGARVRAPALPCPATREARAPCTSCGGALVHRARASTVIQKFITVTTRSCTVHESSTVIQKFMTVNVETTSPPYALRATEPSATPPSPPGHTKSLWEVGWKGPYRDSCYICRPHSTPCLPPEQRLLHRHLGNGRSCRCRSYLPAS